MMVINGGYMTVINLSDKNGSSMSWSAKDAIEYMLSRIETTDKMLIIRLDNPTSDVYDVEFAQAGLRTSECIALLEVIKTVFLEEMGY